MSHNPKNKWIIVLGSTRDPNDDLASAPDVWYRTRLYDTKQEAEKGQADYIQAIDRFHTRVEKYVPRKIDGTIIWKS